MPQIRRDFLLVLGFGFGSIIFTMTAMIMYREPIPFDSNQIVLAARPATSPKESLVRKSQRGTDATQVAKAPPSAPEKPAAAVTPATPSGTETRSTAADTKAVVELAAKPGVPGKKPIEEVRIVRTRIWGEMKEVHDFRNGIKYQGKYHDFRGIDYSEPFPEERITGSR